jgi:hypothetical protein
VDKPQVRSASYLSPPDFHRLNWACMPIAQAFGNPPYLVGSVLTRPDYRDIDIRLILDDEAVDRMFNTNGEWFADGDPKAVRLLLNIAMSDLIAKSANAPAPIDFQIQSMTEANVPEHGARNPLGIRR